MTPSLGNLLSLIFSFCSLSYEFILLKIATSIQGGQIDKYNTIVSVFTFFLGLGALLSSLVKPSKIKVFFIKIEWVISLIAILGVFCSLYFHSITICLITVSIIAILSGMELPFLFNIENTNDKQILTFDYIGMFLSAVIIPLIAFHYIGIAGSLIIVVSLNLYFSLWLLSFTKIRLYSFPLLVLSVFSSFYFSEKLNNVLSSIYQAGIAL